MTSAAAMAIGRAGGQSSLCFVQGSMRGLAAASRPFDHLGKTVGQPISPAEARTSQ